MSQLYTEATVLIENKLLNEWGTTTPIDLDNSQFTPERGNSYIRLQIEWVDKIAVSVGKMERMSGIIMLSVFVPAQKGSSLAMGYADQLCAIFERWNDPRMKCYLGRLQRIGEANNWYQINVLVPFDYTNCSTI